MSRSRSVLVLVLSIAWMSLGFWPGAARAQIAEEVEGASAQGQEFTGEEAATGEVVPNPERKDEESTVSSSGIVDEWAGSWLFLLLVFLFGMVGGLVSELLTLRGRIEWPHRTTSEETSDELEGAIAAHMLDLGVFARLFIGGAAALLVLWVLELDQEGATAVIAGSILAGAAGGAVFQTLRARLEAALASKDLAQTRSLVHQLEGTVEELAVTQGRLRDKLATESESPAGLHVMSFNAPTELELPELDRMETLLGEARALSRAATTGRSVPVREEVLDTLSGWSGIPFARVGRDGKSLEKLWLQNGDNPKLTDEHLGNLIHRLDRRFPRADLDLRPDDLRSGGGVSTVGALIGHVEIRTRGRQR